MSTSLRSTIRQCHAYRGQLHLESIKVTRRCGITLAFLQKRQLELARELSDIPAACHGADDEIYRDLMMSFELLGEKLQVALAQVMNYAPNWEEYGARLPEGSNPAEWEHCLEHMENAVEDYERTVRQRDRARLLSVVELLDTADRLVGLDIPNAKTEGDPCAAYLKRLRASVGELVGRLKRFLRGFDVQAIPLSVGSRPPVDSTRIIRREDNGSDSQVVITRIIEEGQTWKGAVLRKAAVVIAARKD